MCCDLDLIPSLLGLLFGISNLIPVLDVQYITIVLFVVFRPFLFSVASYFTVQMFGTRQFGTVYGAVLCIAAVISWVQYGCDVAAKSQASYTVINVILTALSAPTLLFPLYLRRQTTALQIRAYVLFCSGSVAISCLQRLS